MAQKVCLSAQLMCSFGMMPSVFAVVVPTVNDEVKPSANIMDNVPLVNIMPFGMCQSLANPTVAAATAAALGVLTPMPCLPVIPAPWAPGSPTVMLRNFPALNNTSKCECAYAGVIQVVSAGSTKEMVA